MTADDITTTNAQEGSAMATKTITGRDLKVGDDVVNRGDVRTIERDDDECCVEVCFSDGETEMYDYEQAIEIEIEGQGDAKQYVIVVGNPVDGLRFHVTSDPEVDRDRFGWDVEFWVVEAAPLPAPAAQRD